ncbi:MAG TPA: L-histidine N(alpha)-methyltransferase [Gammaproteobacteria bacterium]|nr:L-histidine N(alpha)-methyltransferase [Gammaproteobacteria bacterium]
MQGAQHPQLMTDRFQINRLVPDRIITSMSEDVRSGLSVVDKILPPKYFYDERGSRLFDLICQTPEYYLTRTEAALLTEHASDIITSSCPTAIVEFGSGTADKTELLINVAGQQRGTLHYLPFDVCEEMLIESGQRLHDRYPWLHVEAWHGDFTHGLTHFVNDHDRTLYTFLGSSIGNFTPDEATAFLTDLRAEMADDDFFLLGIDLIKDSAVLNAAYNDNAGYTAAFNLNLLNILNRELDANFDTGRFRHHAYFDSEAERVEMQLISCCDHTVDIDDLELSVAFKADEYITTEYSHKYTRDAVSQLLVSAGFEPRRYYLDDESRFMLALAACAS